MLHIIIRIRSVIFAGILVAKLFKELIRSPSKKRSKKTDDPVIDICPKCGKILDGSDCCSKK